MNAVKLEHPTGATLTAYGLGKLNEEEFAGIDRHLAECAACRQVLEGVPPDTLLMLLRSSATEPDSSADNGKMTGLHAASRSTATQIAPPQALVDHPRYRTGDLIGVGGMGAVYKAEHLLMQRPVAVKVLNHELIDNPASIDRFRREVRAAARLTHPNIVAAFDAEQAGEVHFLAMEYVEGVSLARRCAEYGPLSVAEACSYARQAALGLQHAHECGMVHRDIKPQNLMLTPGGQVKILDFGLARFVMESAAAGALLPTDGDPAQTSGPDSKAKPLTQIGVVMGTPDYIAPEQAQDSHQADIRADIYSLGCTLYDMLAGHAPFPDGNAVQKVKAHLHKTPPSLKTLRRDLPLELVRVIERMMAKDPDQRYQTPAEAAAALAPFASSGPARRKRLPLLAATLGFVAALVLGAIIYVQTDRGTIVIETNDDKIAVMIEKAGGVKIVDQANKREYLLRPGAQDMPSGTYLIEATEPLAGLDFETKKFELKRGKEVRLTAGFVPKDPGQLDILSKQASGDQGPLFGGTPASFWLNQLQDANPEFRVKAVKALGNIAQKNKNLIPVLVDSLKDKDYEVGKAALKSLGSLGPDAKPAIPAMVDALGNCLKSEDSYVSSGWGNAFTSDFSEYAFPHVLARALKRIDPEIQDFPPQSGKGKTMNEAKQAAQLQWQKAYEVLKKRYLTQTGAGGQTGAAAVDLKEELAKFEGTWSTVKQQVRWEITHPWTKYIFSGSTMTIVEVIDLGYMDRAAEAEFNRYDRNSDGFLNQDEMPPQLKAELSKWDTNRDNLISLDEYKLYYAAHEQNRRADEQVFAIMTFKIDPSKTPKTIDLYRPATDQREANTGLGIYELTGDTLKICVGTAPDAKRPTSFADTEKNLSIVFLKKGEPAQAADGISPKPDQGPPFGGKKGGKGGGKKGGKGVGDRNRVFDILANGRAYFLISDVSPRLGSALWQYLKDKGITNGQVTREIFEAFNEDGSQLSAGEDNIKSEQAIKALGGAVVRNPDAPGRPIIHVDFFGTHVTDAGLKELAGLKSLQTLNLEGTGVTDAGLKELAGLKSLRVLNLCVTKVTDDGLKELSALMDLQLLSLQQTNVTDAGLKGLKGLISLKKLDLFHTKVTDAGLKELKDLHSLQDLSLHRTNVTDAGLKELASLQSLHTLDLSFTRVTNAGLKELAGLKNLHTLYLMGTQVSDAGLKELGGLVSLRALNLNNQKITDAGLRELAGLQSLRGLVLIGTQVTDAGVAELQKALPNCKITRRDPRKVPPPAGPVEKAKSELLLSRNALFGTADMLFKLNQFPEALRRYREIQDRYRNHFEGLLACYKIWSCVGYMVETPEQRSQVRAAALEAVKKARADLETMPEDSEAFRGGPDVWSKAEWQQRLRMIEEKLNAPISK